MRPKIVFALLIIGVILSFSLMYLVLSSLNPDPVTISFANGIDFLEAPKTGGLKSLSTIKQDHFSLSVEPKEKPESQSDDPLSDVDPTPVPENKTASDPSPSAENKTIPGPIIEEKEPDYATRVDNQLLWGTYKPYLLYSITQAAQTRVTFGFVYQTFSRLYHKYKDIAGTQVFSEYPYHNGESYANSMIRDKENNLAISNYFQKQQSKPSHQSWTSITTAAFPPVGFLGEKPKTVSFIYYFALESFLPVKQESQRYLQINREKGLITIRNVKDDSFIGQFQVILYSKKDKTPVSLTSIGASNLRTNLVPVAEHENHNVMQTLDKQLHPDSSANYWKVLPDNYKDSDKEDKKKTMTFVAFQFTFREDISFDIQVSYSSKEEDYKAPDHSAIADIQSFIPNHLLPKLQRKFPAPKDEQTSSCQVMAISNLLSGITYDYGRITIAAERDNQPDLPLFTATPSKTKFPRGFLWDEGFHGLIYCHLSSDLCLKSLTSWMNTQLPNGWIPREQARGPEAISYANRDFLVQKPNEANPPTMLFHLQKLLQEKQLKGLSGLDNQASEMLFDLYPKIFKWMEWFNATQRVDYQGSVFFHWKSDLTRNGLVLGSGLDDYPRGADTGLEPLGHLDLQIWMLFFVEQLEVLAQLKVNTEDIQKVNGLKAQLTIGLEKFFDPKDKIYKDLVKNHKGELEFSPHFGYVNLFPLFFGHLKDPQRVDILLDRIRSEKKLWTQYGLRSLAEDDRMYMRTTDKYWGGPIWINLNYLTLRGLKLYYSDNEKAQRIYTELRDNLIKTVCNNKERTGYFWEQYNQNDGRGQQNHPFNGWTALISLIIAEKY